MRVRSVVAAAAMLLSAGACSVGGGDDDPTYADRFEELEQQGDTVSLLVPIEPPPGYALFSALPARVWVPTGFTSGQVPTVTLCVLPLDAVPPGNCYGTEEADQVGVLDMVAGAERLMVVAKDGTDHTAADMIEDWRYVNYTTDWRSLGWITTAAQDEATPA